MDGGQVMCGIHHDARVDRWTVPIVGSTQRLQRIVVNRNSAGLFLVNPDSTEVQHDGLVQQVS
jgi:hypothetical protein